MADELWLRVPQTLLLDIGDGSLGRLTFQLPLD